MAYGRSAVDFIPIIEDMITATFESCETVEEAGAVWGALSKTISQSAAESVKRLGGDPDRVREALDRFFLVNP